MTGLASRGEGSNTLEKQGVDSWSFREGAAICEVQTKPTNAGEGSDLLYILTGPLCLPHGERVTGGQNGSRGALGERCQ